MDSAIENSGLGFSLLVERWQRREEKSVFCGVVAENEKVIEAENFGSSHNTIKKILRK